MGHPEEQRRVSLRALRREFDLDEDALEELVEELVDIQHVAARDGKALAWVGAATPHVHSPKLSRLTTIAAVSWGALLLVLAGRWRDLAPARVTAAASPPRQLRRS